MQWNLANQSLLLACTPQGMATPVGDAHVETGAGHVGADGCPNPLQGSIPLKPNNVTALSVSSTFFNYAPCLVSNDMVGAAATAVGLNIVPQVCTPGLQPIFSLLFQCCCALQPASCAAREHHDMHDIVWYLE